MSEENMDLSFETRPGERAREAKESVVPEQESLSGFVTKPPKRLREPEGPFSEGKVLLGRYEILGKLGTGGMGAVYKCLDKTSGVKVALKAIPPELSWRVDEMKYVLENFQLVEKLGHQNIVALKTLEKDTEKGDYFLIMEYIDGVNLREWLRQKRKDGGTISLDTVVPILSQAASALDFAHGERVLHRDIKPENIMVSRNGKVKVLDFGIAAQIHTSMTNTGLATGNLQSGDTSGTAPYMSPEQWQGRQPGAKADQYALAVLAYEMLAGHLPFENANLAILREIVLHEEPAPIPNIPPTAQNAIFRAMSKNPKERFANCAEFVAALSRKKSQVPPAVWIGVVAVVLLMAVVLAFIQLSPDNDKQVAQTETQHVEIVEPIEEAEKEAEEKHLAEEMGSMTTLLLPEPATVPPVTKPMVEEMELPGLEKLFFPEPPMEETRTSTVISAPAPKPPVIPKGKKDVEAIDSSLKDAKTYYNRGEFHRKKGESSKAIEAYTEAIRLDPKYVSAYIKRGTIYYNQAHEGHGLVIGTMDILPKAIQDFDKAIELNPKNATAYYNLAIAYIKKYEYDKAIMNFDKAIELNPKNTAAYYNRAVTYINKREFDKAIMDFNEGIRLDPKGTVDAEIYLYRGMAYKATKDATKAEADFDKAIAYCTEALRLDSKDATAYYIRGKAYQMKGDEAKAEADFKQREKIFDDAVKGFKPKFSGNA